MGPLLIWAIRVVEDLVEDILAAWAENRRLTQRAASAHATPEGREALKAYLLPFMETGVAIPASHKHGKPELARMFITGTTGASFGQVDRFKKAHGLTALAAARPGPCPLTVQVTGRINGRPWRKHLDFYEAPFYVTDDDGNHISQGEEREVPWGAITPVVRAIRVLERIVPPAELLLSTAHHDFGTGDRNGHGSLGNNGMIDRIEGFIAWANQEAVTQNLPDQTIPDDPYGTIGMGRFRRSWPGTSHAARSASVTLMPSRLQPRPRTSSSRVTSWWGARGTRGWGSGCADQQLVRAVEAYDDLVTSAVATGSRSRRTSMRP